MSLRSAPRGAERPLKRPADFEQFMGADVLLKTYKPRDGRKEFSGVLTGYDDGAVSPDRRQRNAAL